MEGYTCLELGADVPAAVFAAAAERAAGLVAVGVGVTRAESIDAAADTITAIRRVAPDVPVVLGGQGVRNADVAMVVGASGWAADGAGAVALISELAARRP